MLSITIFLLYYNGRCSQEIKNKKKKEIRYKNWKKSRGHVLLRKFPFQLINKLWDYVGLVQFLYQLRYWLKQIFWPTKHLSWYYNLNVAIPFCHWITNLSKWSTFVFPRICYYPTYLYCLTSWISVVTWCVHANCKWLWEHDCQGHFFIVYPVSG